MRWDTPIPMCLSKCLTWVVTTMEQACAAQRTTWIRRVVKKDKIDQIWPLPSVILSRMTCAG